MKILIKSPLTPLLQGRTDCHPPLIRGIEGDFNFNLNHSLMTLSSEKYLNEVIVFHSIRV